MGNKISKRKLKVKELTQNITDMSNENYSIYNNELYNELNYVNVTNNDILTNIVNNKKELMEVVNSYCSNNPNLKNWAVEQYLKEKANAKNNIHISQ
jgi:hypothetical protein